MSTMKIKKGDTVRVIAGTDKGSEGKVIAVNHKNNTVLVEGVNMITKHTKPSPANQEGGIIHQEGPIDASNVMFVSDGKVSRIGFKMDGDKKVRFAKSTGMGLYIVKGLCDQLGHHLTITSKENIGTDVAVTFGGNDYYLVDE